MAHGANTLRKSRPPRRRPVVEGMEPRILYSADGLSGLLDPLHTDAHPADAQPLLPVLVPDSHNDQAAQSAVTPTPAKRMVHNFFSNLDDILVTGNDLLQFKFAQAASDFTRVWVNSTFGIFGLFDVAHKLEKHNEDFGQTLGHWGVSSGPYLVLPFLGPSSLRDGTGLAVDSYYGVLGNIEDIPTRNSLYVTNKIDLRTELLDTEKILEDTVVDRYSFIRDAYLMRRQSLVYDGDPPREKYDDEE